MRRQGEKEEKIQAAICQYLDYQLPSYAKYFSIPNGAGKLGLALRMALKRTGLKRGIADLEIVVNRIAHFIEVKSDSGRLSDDQKEFEAWCKKTDTPHCVARSVDDVIEFLEKHGIAEMKRQEIKRRGNMSFKDLCDEGNEEFDKKSKNKL